MAEDYIYTKPTEQELKVYKAYARKVARLAGIKAENIPMFLAQINEESGWDPEAYNPNSKAYGFGQITPHYVDEQGNERITHKDGFDGLQAHRAFWPKDRIYAVKDLTERVPENATDQYKEKRWKTNLEYSARFMKFLTDLNGGDIDKAHSDYNGGEGSAPGSKLRNDGNAYAVRIRAASANERATSEAEEAAEKAFGDMLPEEIERVLGALSKAKRIVERDPSGDPNYALRADLTEIEKERLSKLGVIVPGEWNNKAKGTEDIRTAIQNLAVDAAEVGLRLVGVCLLYTSPSPRDS